ncbi:MAG: peptide chain release factor N(5)-glutamine methyltransferase [Clostridia bacterium]|nr:peptide chain release factor N(5)-glutamine methyltransferase [Clostridia bacterium]
MIIKEVLKTAIERLKNKNIEDASMKVKMILSDTLNKEKEYLLVHDQDELDEDILKVFDERLNKLISGKPIQYILNKQDFMGLHFYVDENVLIPQPDTENLVEEVIKISKTLKMSKEQLKVLDMCTGSGAIAVSLSKYVDKALIYASDISINALDVAKKNAKSNSLDITFIHSDLFNDIEISNQFDIIVSNPPYIETEVIKSLSKEVQEEPIIALDGGKDGLDFYREIIKCAKEYLIKDGYLALEIGYDQKDSVIKLLQDNDYKNIYSKKDLSGNDRVVVGQK